MPSSTVGAFTDPAEYVAALRGVRGNIVLTQKGEFRAKLASIALHRLLMQRLSDSLPRVAHIALTPERDVIGFLTQPAPAHLVGSLEMSNTAITHVSGIGDYFMRSSGDTSIAAMSLPGESMASVVASVSGRAESSPGRIRTLTPPPASMGKLQRLHGSAVYLAEHAPEIIAHPEAARGLEEALLLAMVECLHPADATGGRVSNHRHDAIMRRFHRTVEEHAEEPLYIPELCAAVGVPQRTLHACCMESLGMGPKRYLLLRRMELARRQLRKSDAARTTVTAIAASLGFWNFGRFAVEYKALFGEAPAATLRRPTE